MTVELRIFTEPQQGATYDDLLAVAQEAERLGYGAFFRSDHYLAMGGDGRPGPTDAWTTLAGLARETTTIRLGTLMTSATFRHPGVLAIQVAQVDQMSRGRIELGLGAGWYAEEHEAYGIPFPDTRTRFARFAEQLEIVTGLWAAPTAPTGSGAPSGAADGGFTYEGEHYTVRNSPGLPKPVQSGGRRGGPPVLIGGQGKKQTPALAARFADEFNMPFASVADTEAQFGRVRTALEAIEREAGSLTLSNALVVCVGEDEAQVERRAAAIGRDKAELRENGVAGTPEEAVERIQAYAALGSTRVYLQVLDLSDLDHLRLIAEEVMPHL